MPEIWDDHCERVELARKNREYAEEKRAAYYKHPLDRTPAEQHLASLYVDDLCGVNQ